MRIGIVIPLFKQSQYLVECVTSALEQTLLPTGVVIVNDGCPNPSSDFLSRALAAAWPEKLLYLRQENFGLGAARNRGIEALLARWPGIDAIFMLDADNWLDSRALETMAGHLAANEGLDWVYPDMQRFGGDFVNSRPWPRLSPYRQLLYNQCDAGCLIRRRVFDAGLRFAETLRPQGVEDWEFFIHATLRGFRGGSGGAAGFYYRVQHASMLSGATKEFETAKNALYARHAGILKPWNVVACEHRHLPRFRFIDEACTARDFSDPHLSSTFDQSCDPGYAPPITILGFGSAFERLRGAGVLRGILLAMHYQTRAHALPVGVELGGTGLRFERRGDVAKAPHLLAVQTRWLSEGVMRPESIDAAIGAAEGLNVALGGGGSVSELGSGVNFGGLLRHAGTLASHELIRQQGPLEWVAGSNTWYAAWHQLESDPNEIVYPLSATRGINVCIVVPALGPGQPTHCVVRMAEAVRRLHRTVRIHLLATESGAIDLADLRRGFDEIVSVAPWEREQRLSMTASVLGGMDVIINSHSDLGYEALPLIQGRTRAVHRPFHVACVSRPIEGEEYPPARGSPYIACKYEGEIDAFLVASHELRDFLSNSGVNEERIHIVRPASDQAGRILERLLAAGAQAGSCRPVTSEGGGMWA